MTREEAKTVRIKHRDVMIAEPNAAVECDEPIPMHLVTSEKQPNLAPSNDASQILSKIERLVCDLEKALERGDIRRDAIFDGRVRALHERLWSLIVDDAPVRSRRSE